MADFEALERYIIAAERARLYARDIDLLVEQVEQESQPSIIAHVGNITAEEAQILIQELKKHLAVVIEEANSYAEACGKPKLDIQTLGK